MGRIDKQFIVKFHPIIIMLRLLKPTWRCKSLLLLDTTLLKHHGIKCILLDKDNTITEHKQNVVSPEMKQKLMELKQDFDVSIVSNREGSKKDVSFALATEFEQIVEIPIVRHGSTKPFLPFPSLNYKRNEICVIGDRILTDVVFGNRNGTTTCLLDPISNKYEPIGIRFMRWIEGIL
jgi:phosphatidylglycerophosphatase GEP4